MIQPSGTTTVLDLDLDFFYTLQGPFLAIFAMELVIFLFAKKKKKKNAHQANKLTGGQSRYTDTETGYFLWK